jgi:hypothetical protein
MSDRRNGEVEIASDLAAENEIPQEGSHGRDQLLGRFGSTLARAIQQERAHCQGIPLADIFTKYMEQFQRTTGVQPESRLSSATMHLEPVAKGNDQCRKIVADIYGKALTDSLLNQIPVEELYSKVCVITGLPTVGLRAATA